jgi:tetratricopeptide (TPR) repeat protein
MADTRKPQTRFVKSRTANEPALRGKATFNLGLTLKQLARYDEAIKVFEDLIDQPVDDQEAGAHLMEAYRNYCPRAQWEIGNCLISKNDHAGGARCLSPNQGKRAGK